MDSSGSLHGVKQVRNIALVGHAGAGKTTLTEALLQKSGAIASVGQVEKGSTVSDFTAYEKEAGHSLDPAVCHIDHAGIRVNLLDTPGYPDFLGRTMSVLPAVETAVLVVDAVHGMGTATERIMEFAGSRNLCRAIVINRIDAPGADCQGVLKAVTENFGDECLPLNLPADGGQKVADCYFSHDEVETDFSSVAEAHTRIVDQVVELDDELMEIYLEQGEEIKPEQLHDPFERALRRGHLIPVCFVSAATGQGLTQLLRIFEDLMPSPLEGNPPEFFKGEGEETPVGVTTDEAGHFIGHVFKITIDAYVGRQAAVRVHQGRIKTGDHVFMGDKRKAFRVAHLYDIQGKDLKEIPAAGPGDICALTKLDELEFDAVLHSSHDEDYFHLRPVDLPPPMYGLAIELQRRGDEKKLSDAIHKFLAEDPSLKVEHNPQQNETVVRGLGDLHLRAVMERMKDDYHVELSTHAPSVAYRETITRDADGHSRHKKQTGGAGQFGEVFLKVEPLPRGSGFEFVNRVVGGSIPSQFIPAVEKGVRSVIKEGAIAGFPIQDVRVTVYDGKHHPVDSKEVAFVAAGRKAFMDAIDKARPIVLEPIAHVDITAPGDHVGDVTGQLSGIRGRVSGNEVMSHNLVRISAEVPVSEMDDYQAKLKSLTGGTGSFTMSFDHYEPAPPPIQKELTERYHQ